MRDDPMRCSEVANAMLEWQINRGSPLLSLREKYDYYFLGSLHTMIQMTGTLGLAVGHTCLAPQAVLQSVEEEFASNERQTKAVRPGATTNKALHTGAGIAGITRRTDHSLFYVTIIIDTRT